MIYMYNGTLVMKMMQHILRTASQLSISEKNC